jgi:type I restriction enzyme S subunit
MTATETAIQGAALRGYRPYPAYKASGVEWLGEIPKHWDVKRLKNAVKKLETGGTPESNNSDFWTDGDDLEGTAWVAISDMTRSFHVRETVKRLTADGLLSKRLPVLPSGTLLYSMYASLGKVALLEIDAVVNQAILGIVPDTSTVSRAYLRWWLEFMQGHIQILSSSSTQENLNAEKVRNIPVFLPDEATQQAIANFLDSETARIDALVAKKQRLIELLHEQRTTLITRAVTKGLDGSVPMKESGVEWLGEIPAHWEVKKIKRLCLVRRGASPRPIEDPVYFDDEGEYAWVRIADVTASERYLEETTQRLSELGKAKSVPLDPGELFVSIAGTVGKPIITRIKCCIHDGFVYFAYLRESREYLYYLFSCGEPYKGLGKLGTQLNLNTDTIGDIYLPRPSMVEQERIVSYLDAEAAKINVLIGKVLDAITKLGELRAALISAAVTGKIDVREEVV